MRHNFSEEMIVKGNVSFTVFYDSNVSKQDVIKSLHLISTNPGVHVYFDEASFLAKDPLIDTEQVRFTRKKVNYPPPFQAVPKVSKEEENLIEEKIEEKQQPILNNNTTFKALEGIQ